MNGRDKTRRAAAIIFAIAGLTGVGAAINVLPAAAGDSRNLGGVDLNLACRLQNSSPLAYAVNGSNAYKWSCYINSRDVGGIDIDRECRWEYGYDAYAVTVNAASPWSWTCWREW